MSPTILEEAASLVDGPREKTYGHPRDDFLKVTGAAQALGIDPINGGPLHHAMYMILVKLSRLVQTPDHRDSIVDIAGYARTYEKCLRTTITPAESGLRYTINPSDELGGL